MFLPVGDDKIAIRVEHPDVPCVEPPIRADCLTCSRSIIPVPPHDMGSTREDLAIRSNLHLNTRDRLSHSTKFVIINRVYGNNGRCLRKTITLDNLDPQRFKELPEFSGERCATRNEEPNSATDAGFQLLVDDPTGRAMSHS